MACQHSLDDQTLLLQAGADRAALIVQSVNAMKQKTLSSSIPPRWPSGERPWVPS